MGAGTANRKRDYSKYIEEQRRLLNPLTFEQTTPAIVPYATAPGYAPLPGYGSGAPAPGRGAPPPTAAATALRNYLAQSQEQRTAQLGDYDPYAKNTGGAGNGAVSTV